MNVQGLIFYQKSLWAL